MKSFLFVCILGLSTLAMAAKDVHHLDWMIDHHTQAIEKMKSFKDEDVHKDIKKLNERMLAKEEKELKEMLKLKHKLFPEQKEKTDHQFSSFKKEFEKDMRRLQEETSKLIQRYSKGIKFDPVDEAGFPNVEIKDMKKSYEIKAEVPGIEKENIKVEVRGNDLVIKGERKEEVKKEEEGEYSSEFSYGEFNRTIRLDEKVDPSSLKTTHKDGLLHIQLNKVSL